MSVQYANLGKFPRAPYEIGVEAGRTANVAYETMYTTTDGQSTFPYQEIEFTVPEAKDRTLVRRPDFVRGFHRGSGQLQSVKEQK